MSINLTFENTNPQKSDMPFQKGNTVGRQFTSEIQPENNTGRPPGARSRSTIAKKWLETETNWTNPLTGNVEKLSLEDQITLAQIKAARDNEHSPAYKALMDTAYGNTRQEVDLVGEIKITDNRLTISVIPPEDDIDNE